MQTNSMASARKAVVRFLLCYALLTGMFLPRMQASTDYGPAMWYPACSGKWYTSGYGKKFFVIHDMEGYFASGLAYLARCDIKVSIHYMCNSKKDATSDYAAGTIAQEVRDAYYAWHARCWNQYSMGTEHEGFAGNPAWYTEAMYVASASLSKSKATKYGMAKDRNHIIGHDQKRISGWASYCSSHFGVSGTCNDHSDPGTHWQWSHYMDLVAGTTSTPTAPTTLAATAASATQINLSWKDNASNETGYKVERSTSATTGFAQIGTVGASVKTYSSTGLASGTTYYYRVRAYNAGGNSGYSNTANATTKDTIPAAPTTLTATAISDVQVNLTWAQSSANEDGFRIYRSTDGTNFAQVATAAINATTYSNTGLTGNRQYWYRVYSYNTAGNSAASNTAVDTTAPQAPTALAAASAGTGETTWNKINLTWTDNASTETGFKVERGAAAAGPFTQIATPATAGFQDTGLAATTTYYYRVRSYNVNGNSVYSAVVSATTPNAPPIMSAIGNRTVASASALAFTVTATDPNAVAATTTTWQNFQTFGHSTPNETILFKKPSNSGSTASFIDTAATNYTAVFSNGPSAWGAGNKALKAQWNFKTGINDMWVRLNTVNTTTNPNPTIALDQKLQFKYYASHSLKIGLGIRESGTTAAYGANGGTTGVLEWVGVTNIVGGVPIPNRAVPLNTATTLVWNIPFEPQAAFTGDGVVPQNNVKGVLEHVILYGSSGVSGVNSVWFDDFAVVVANRISYTLDAGAPAGASIGYRNGKFAWTPTTNQVGRWSITVRTTDQLGAQDFETFKVTVTGTGNVPPTLATIGNQTVNEGGTLSFTATATDANPGQVLTFSLDAGAPAGASIDGSTGAFSWTPTEAQAPGTYPITVRVVDDSVPASNDVETIVVTVNEVNTAPVLAAIADQTAIEGSAFTFTVPAPTDSDLPANTFTYSVEGPAGMTINPTSGLISWTPGEQNGGESDQVTVTVRDNGVPSLYAVQTFNVAVAELNSTPNVVLGTANTSTTPLIDFENDEEGSYNGTVLFRQPSYSGTTSTFIDSTGNNTSIESVYPDFEGNGSLKALKVAMKFKTGTTNAWCRLVTYMNGTYTNSYLLPNPTIDFRKHLRFKVWTDRSLKIGLGIRETGLDLPIGANGRTTGEIEWLGVPSQNGTAPNPSRTINASNWTTVDFNCPTENVRNAMGVGDGVLEGIKGTIEHLAVVPNNGTGLYNIYFDDFEVYETTNTLAVDAGGTITVDNNATDPDSPAQTLAFSLGTNAPANASIDETTGLFTWTPDGTYGGTTNLIPITVTDDGVPALSNTKNLTVIVRKVNTPPEIAFIPDLSVETLSGQNITFTASAEDDDLPAQTITWSLISPPSGATINPTTGVFSWTPPSGAATYEILIKAIDNGSPALYDEQTVMIEVTPTNTAPTLSLGTARITEPVATFDTFTDGTSGVLFRNPAASTTTSVYVDTGVADSTAVTTNFPAGNASAGANVLKAEWAFTGASNYWVQLFTAGTTYLPNPTINLGARVKFDIYTTKALKVALGVRETGSTAEIGDNGGTTGQLEWLGVSGVSSGTPVPTRSVAAGTWTTLEFNLPAEPIAAFPSSGNGALATGQGVLEHLALVGDGGTGTYTVYLDNLEVVGTASLPATVTVKQGSRLTFTASATDPNPGSGLNYGIDADTVDNTTATIDILTGAFAWGPAIAGTTNDITVTVQDNPTNGGIVKADSKIFTILVATDAFAAQSATDGVFVAGGDKAVLSWSSTPGAAYQIEYKAKGGTWTAQQSVTATGASASVEVTNAGTDGSFRVVDAGASAE